MNNISSSLLPWLEKVNQLSANWRDDGQVQTASNTREALDNLTRSLTHPRQPIAWVRDDLIQLINGWQIPLRLYHPEPSLHLPVLLFFHGGGHMAGSVPLYDPLCRQLALCSQHIVVSVEYRLAPECPYPAGLTDAYQAARHVFAVLDRRGVNYRPSLRLCGDSAGGALSATVAHRAQYDATVNIDGQVLIYPSLDYTLSQPSIQENAEGYLLHKSKILWYFDHYFQQAEDLKAVSPFFMEITPNYPATLVVTAQFDPLRDEGIAYVTKLHAAAVRAERLHFDDMIHAFMNLEKLVPKATARVYQQAAEFLNSLP